MECVMECVPLAAFRSLRTPQRHKITSQNQYEKPPNIPTAYLGAKLNKNVVVSALTFFCSLEKALEPPRFSP